MTAVSPLNKLTQMFSIWDPDSSGGSLLIVKTDTDYVWNNNASDMNTGSPAGRSTMKLVIAGESAGSLNGVTVSSGQVTIQFQSGVSIFDVLIKEDEYGTGFHKLDFSNITTTGYIEFHFWDGYVQREFTGFRAIDPNI